ncbi:MAG: aldehyde dehydrogenase family protein [Myxococcota bacterium]
MGESPEEIVSRSPAAPDDVVGRFSVADVEAVNHAVGRAAAAFHAWRDLGLAGRAAVLERFRDLANVRAEEGARLVAREVGKALWDARGETRLLGPKVDVSLAEGMALVAEQDAGGGARATHHPRGVLAVLGPFNFPAHLPNGHIVPALATGNSVVFKPSEVAPAVGEWLVGLFREAGLPEGVLEVVHGGVETGGQLATHRSVDGVLFTGSWRAGRALSEATLDQPFKILALEMGGRNAVVVMDDADLDLAVAESALSIAVTTGQRCSCASRLFVHRKLADAFTDKLRAVLGGLAIGDPMDDGVFMGPLATAAAHAKVLHYRRLAEEAGGERILEVDPKLPAPFIGPGLVRFPRADQDHPCQRDEIFGPEAALYPVDDLDEAVAAVNDSDYGLVASVFTRDRARWEHCVGRVRTGLLNWNKGTTGASGKLPFGGLGRSGNDRPAGVSASLYCTHPQAHLEVDGASARLDPESLPPGMPRPR